VTRRKLQRVALTGGIATGKSYALGRFAAMGVPVVDADRLAHEAVERGRPGLDAVVARFGRDVLQSDGSLDRSALGRIVFADADARRDLERIIHPIVYRGISDWFAALPPRTSFAIADVPLLYETGREGDFDAVIVTSCRPDLQLERLVARSGLSEAEARQRIAAQMPTSEKAARATYVVDTSTDFGDTNRQIEEIANKLRAKPARAPR